VDFSNLSAGFNPWPPRFIYGVGLEVAPTRRPRLEQDAGSGRGSSPNGGPVLITYLLVTIAAQFPTAGLSVPTAWLTSDAAETDARCPASARPALEVGFKLLDWRSCMSAASAQNDDSCDRAYHPVDWPPTRPCRGSSATLHRRFQTPDRVDLAWASCRRVLHAVRLSGGGGAGSTT